MQEATKPFAIRAPTQVGTGINGSLCGLAKQVIFPEWKKPPQDASERDLVYRKRRLTLTAPHALVRVCEKCVNDLTKSGAAVAAVFVGQLLGSEI
jgi:hypothetical protein